MHCLVTPVEGKSVRRPAWWVTLKVLGRYCCYYWKVVYYEPLKRALKTKARAKEKSVFVYYESLKRELKTKTIYGCRCDERLKN